MNFVITNNSSRDLSQLTPLIQEFYPYAKKHMGFDRDASISFESDLENAKNPLGKTAFYDPSNDAITIFIDNRHPKDIMRSVSHELVHHHQNCDGKFENIGPTEEGYAQSDPYLREMEEDAYRRGNLIFRDWENQQNIKEIRKMKVTKEQLRNYVYEAMKEVLNEKVRKDSPDRRQGDEPPDRVKPLEEVEEEDLQEVSPAQARELGGTQMHSPEAQEQLRNTIEDAKRTLSLHDSGKMKLPRHVVDALGALVAGAGDASQPGLPLGKDKGHFEEAAKPDFLDVDKDGDKEESMKAAAGDKKEESLNEDDGIPMSIDGVFAPNHYCVHHGGVEMDGKIQEGKVVNHNWNEDLQKVTAYDMEFANGTVVKNIPVESIAITKASLAEAHGSHMAKRDHEDSKEDDSKKKEGEEETVDEGADSDDWYASTEEKDWKKPEEEEEDKKKKDLDSFGAGMAGAQSGVNEEVDDADEIKEEAEEEETLSEWKNNTLYKKLLKEYTKR